MKITDLADYRQLCTRGRPAVCSRSCPFGLDVYTFLRKISAGDHTGALQLYSRTVLFPRIVSCLCDAPCSKECPAHIDIHRAEQFCIQNGCSEHKLLKLPKKQSRIAITNAGPAALSAALVLSQRGWNVDVYTSSDRPGERIRDVLPTDIVEKDLAILAKSRIRFFFESILPDADTYDYVYHPSSAIDVRLIAAGIRDAEIIEKALKLKKTPSVPCMQEPSSIRASSAIIFQSEQIRDPVQEDTVCKDAKLCTGCQCSTCMDRCPVMNYYQRSPDQIFPDLISTLGLVNIQTRRIAQKMIFSCLYCGLCDCPEGIDLKNIFHFSRGIINREGKMPPAYHEFWLKDMEHALSDDALIAISQPEAGYLFFPGCQLGASAHESVIAVLDLLKEYLGAVSLYSGCCGISAHWAGDIDLEKSALYRFVDFWRSAGSPQILWTCPNCAGQLKSQIPENKLLSVYELLCERDVINQHLGDFKHRQKASVFDPCSAAECEDSVRESVRKLARQSGFSLSPSPEIRCCGNGGHMQAVVPDLFEKTASDAAASYTGDMITYCINCRDIFAYRNKRAAHILDLILCKSSQDLDAAFSRSAPSWGERRRNREILHSILTGGSVLKTDKTLLISPELKDKIFRELLTEQEILDTIMWCEHSGQKLFHEAGSCFIGHKQSGSITIWVMWNEEPERYILKNVYSHRMEILKRTDSISEEKNGQ